MADVNNLLVCTVSHQTNFQKGHNILFFGLKEKGVCVPLSQLW